MTTTRRRRCSRRRSTHGITFFDTADVYGDGRSERFCAGLRRRHPGVLIATKMGRRARQLPENYNRAAFRDWNAPLARQPRRRAARPRAAALPARRGLRRRRRLRGARRDGRRRADRGLRRLGRDLRRRRCAAIERPRVATVQIILNCFRLKPLERVLPAARAAGRRDHRARAARLRAALGPLRRAHQFAPDDHRSYNRHGEAFDVGETFSGVPYDVGAARRPRAARRSSTRA